MKEPKVVLKNSAPCTVKIPELGLHVTFEIIDAQIAIIGLGVNVLNTTLKIVNQEAINKKPFIGIPLNQLSEEQLDKMSMFEFDDPAKARFEAQSGEKVDVYAEPVLVRFSDRYITGLGFPHFNISTMSGAIIVQND